MKGTCIFDCTRPAHQRGLCVGHYMEFRKQGTLEEHALPPQRPAVTASGRRMGERWLSTEGYVLVRTQDGTMAEHRVVMAEKIGRPLRRGESVHHINGDKADNRPENLELWWRPQPGGQRVRQLIDYVVEHHADELRRRLAPDGREAALTATLRA